MLVRSDSGCLHRTTVPQFGRGDLNDLASAGKLYSPAVRGFGLEQKTQDPT